jgi:death-on-curing protein
MRYLTLGEVVALHRAIVASSGGGDGIRDLGALESALAQPKATFGSEDLYPSAAEKASALAFSLAMIIRSSTGTGGSPTPRWRCSST